jgi:squalene-hopene/tetraprenyl-beta-curcumene cyclase
MASKLVWIALTLPAFGADWNPRLAADFLDARQQAWFEWQPAAATGGPCVSCHTGLTYLIARPALRRALGEMRPTKYETGYLDALRARVSKTEGLLPSFPNPPGSTQAAGVESIFAAYFLGTPESFDRMWRLQGADGTIPWFSLKLDPWEMPESKFFGASLAALAVGRAGSKDQAAPLIDYLKRESANQPLHNRVMLLWTSSTLPEAFPARDAAIKEAFSKQSPDGGWTIASLGPWSEHPAAAPSSGSDAYATAFTAFALEQAGVRATDPRMRRALDWLAAHQDKNGGFWDSKSLNKKYDKGSMPDLFMRDAATAFASLALVR